MNNLLRSSKTDLPVLHSTIPKLQARLDALLLVLKGCKASACTHPWSVLHPKGNVENLADALSAEYDDFYAKQPKVSFSKCELGQILSSEGPQNGFAYQGTGMWPHWV